MENHRITNEFSQKQRLFDCANVLNPLTCKHCPNFATHRLVQLKKHYKTHHKLVEKMYICPWCDFQTTSRFVSERHKQFDLCPKRHKKKTRTRSTRRKEHKCKYCPYETPHFGRLRYHIVRKHTLHEQFECDLCPYQNKVKFNIELHMYSEHAETLYNSSPKFNKNHIWMEHSYSLLDLRVKPMFHCKQCSYKTDRAWNLKQHEQNVHKTGVLRCKYFYYCRFKTNSPGMLRRHLTLRHKPDDLLKCGQCETETIPKQYIYLEKT